MKKWMSQPLVRKIATYTVLVLFLVVLNYIAGSRMINTNFPWYSNVSVFLLVNINIILLIVLIIIIFRNVGKLLAERKKGIFGTRLQTKLVIFSVMLAVLPVFVVFIFSSSIINNSIDKWFDSQVEQALESSIDLMQRYQNRLEQDIIEQAGIVAQLVTSKEFLLKQNYSELQGFMSDYMNRNRIKGIAIYNNQKVRLAIDDRSYFLYSFIDDAVLRDILDRKQVARYEFFGNNQVYWVGQPIMSRVNENVVTGALFIYREVPANQAEKVAKILDSYSNYSQIKFFSQPIKNSYKVLLILMTLLVVFAGIWGSLVFARSITGRLEHLSEASMQVSRGNLDIVVEPAGDDEIGFLAATFNDMTKRLKEHTQELSRKNRKLSEMFVQISKDSQYIDTVFKNVKSAIFLFDDNMTVLKSNMLAERIINETPDYAERILPEMQAFRETANREENTQLELNLDGSARIYTVNKTKIFSPTGQLENLVVVLDDVTDIIHFQRMSIWQEIAKRIAHEIKNPLTPIKLTAERMRKKARDLDDETYGDMFASSMDTIINEVNALRYMVDEFNMFARLPELAKEEFDLAGLITEVAAFYQQSHPDVTFDIDIESGITLVADRRQLKRVFINLVNNSLHAMNDRGTITMHAKDVNGAVEVVYQDTGGGIREEYLAKIFLPYFSKRPDGTGLGLAIVKRIIDEHDGSIQAESSFGDYMRFTISIPKGTAA